MTRSRVLMAVFAMGLLAVAASVPAQVPPTPAPRPGDTLGWHVVRPGDTLERITEHYLGTPKLWRENWRLNPWIEDPNLLHPGDRLRVIVARELPPRTAEVEKVAHKVEEKPHPNPWTPAREGDLLKERDGVRTHRRSSARLRFDDGTRITLTEESLVFLRQVRKTLLGGTRDTLEVVEGQADLEARPRRADLTDLEVVVGGAVARPKPGRTGTAAARLRREKGSGAQVMVYRGASEVEAAGRAVEVPEGMGTAVPKDGPPAPPEKLLPAPALGRPAAGARFGWSNPELAWSPVRGAASYTVEVCRDRGCAELVERATGLTDTAWRPGSLPEGKLFWRVTAVSASGLDGYPAKARAVEIGGPAPDLEPPAVAIFAGPGAAASAEGFTALPGSTLGLAAVDDASGVVEVLYRWDGGGWRRWSGGPVAVPIAAGGHRFEVRARDRAGRASPPVTVPVTVGGEVPPPPELHGGVRPTGGGA